MDFEKMKQVPDLPIEYLETLNKKLKKAYNIFVGIKEILNHGMDTYEFAQRLTEHGFHIIKKNKGVVITRPKE
mgnify:CR=1 FL=1